MEKNDEIQRANAVADAQFFVDVLLPVESLIYPISRSSHLRCFYRINGTASINIMTISRSDIELGTTT